MIAQRWTTINLNRLYISRRRPSYFSGIRPRYSSESNAERRYQLTAPFDKVLIANRGEIACRVIRTAKQMGLKTVAVYSNADANAEHVRQADEAVHIGPSASSESYLAVDRIIEACKRTSSGAVHPGYGFLSENIDFCNECAKNDIVFIGPSPFAIKAMGNKSESKHLMEAAGVPLSPGYHGDDMSDDTLLQEARRIGYPVMIKAVAGGGGKGMRIVHEDENFIEALDSCRRESAKAFNYDVVLLEKYISNPRHVEFQVFGDSLGNVVHLMERDCSVQRRHQKIFEESPAFMLPSETHEHMAAAAVACAKAVNYVGAGTVEFLVDSETNAFYFCEMNTRLQVEHPVTELVTGQDLVEWQIRVARGEKLPLSQDEIAANVRGSAIEARIYAENPLNGFLPASGPLLHVRQPRNGNGSEGVIRADSGVVAGDTVSTHYDPMIAKLIVHSENREKALQLMETALKQYQVAGIPNNIDFLAKVVKHPGFVKEVATTGFFDQYLETILDSLDPAISLDSITTAQKFGVVSYLHAIGSQSPSGSDIWGGGVSEAVNWRSGRTLQKVINMEVTGAESRLAVAVDHVGLSEYSLHTLSADGEVAENIGNCGLISGTPYIQCSTHSVWDNKIVIDGVQVSGTICVKYPTLAKGSIVDVWVNSDDDETSHLQFTISQNDKVADFEDSGNRMAYAPMPGKVVKSLVSNTQHVQKGDPILILEAMKMEHLVVAPSSGSVQVFCTIGENVQDGDRLAEVSGSD